MPTCPAGARSARRRRCSTRRGRPWCTVTDNGASSRFGATA
jgi:hypothetical protein